MISVPTSLEAETVSPHNEEIAFPFRWVAQPSLPSDECDAPGAILQRQFDATHVEQRVITSQQTSYPGTGGWREIDPDSRLTEGQPAIDVTSLLRDAVRDFTDRISTNLEEDIEDASATDDFLPGRGAVEACLRLARRLAPHVVLSPKLKCAAFATESGEVALVLQSLVTDRRLTCRIAADGSTMLVHQIDETMEATQASLRTNDASVPRELAQWVIKRT